jgi:hypothetical protein
VILVYPSAIRFGDQPDGVDPEEALHELVPRAIAQRKERQRPERAQVNFLQQRLPTAVREIGDNPFFVFGLLDNAPRRERPLTVCILVRGADDYALEVDGPPDADDDFMSGRSGYGVDAQGAIVSEFEHAPSTPFCAIVRYCPADFRGPLTITERATGRRHTYEVKSENITHVSASE